MAVNALDFFTIYFDSFVTGVSNEYGNSAESTHVFYNIAPYYISFGFLEIVKLSGTTAQRIQATKLGSSFYAALEAKGLTNK